MKSIITTLGKVMCLASFAAVILLVVAGNCDAQETSKTPVVKPTSSLQISQKPAWDNLPDMNGAIAAIEQQVIRASVAGNTEEAAKWSQTLLAVHASRYVGPIGDLLSNFKDATKKAPELFMISMEIDEAVAPTRPYQVAWRSQAAVSVFKGDTRAFRKALVNQKLWEALWSWEDAAPEQEKLSNDSAALLTARNWVEVGCPTEVPELIKPVVQSHKFQMTLMQLRPQLAASN